jgi:cell division septation protein DedD
MLMLLFSGVFFTLGYVMGRNQSEGEVRAASNLSATTPEVAPLAKADKVSKRAKETPPVAETPTDSAAPPNSDWEFYNAGKSKQTDDQLKSLPPASKQKPPLTPVSNVAPPKSSAAAGSKPANAPLIPGGAYTLQVAALTKEADAFDLATRLQKKKFPAFVLSPKGDKYYRVQVGPYADQKAAEAARKGLEGAGFRAIVKHG